MILPDALTTAGLTARAVSDCPAADLAACLNAGFTGYLVTFQLDAPTASRRFASEDLDPVVSRLLFGPNHEPAGVLLIDRRGWNTRIAAMGLAPVWRHRGFGRPLLDLAITEARERGDRTLCLEVFAQNEPALRLYQQLGFQSRRDLVGYELAAGTSISLTPEALAEANLLTVARVVATDGAADLPWQLTAETLAAATPPWRAWQLNDVAYAVVQPVSDERILLRSLIVRRSARRQGWGRRLLHALAAANPRVGWFLAPTAPTEIVTPFFEAIGWQRHRPLYQHEMHLGLKGME